MSKIEETVYQKGLPVNTFPVLDRIKELMNAHGTNNVGDLHNILEVRECMLLLNMQFGREEPVPYIRFDDQFDEWSRLRKIRHALGKGFIGVKVKKSEE